MLINNRKRDGYFEILNYLLTFSPSDLVISNKSCIFAA